ncbi:ACP5 [Bugula neritina]|uniref:ACP5 n=1 Tax=Bugula neritina TaxID=10212 RepID=A0A7J7JQ59_BUGNE|nr:ACP5 [Bugula neritina]
MLPSEVYFRKYPDYYYTKTFTSPDGATIEFVMVDTMIICGTVEKEGEQPNHLMIRKAEEEEWAWIEEKLANSTADYLVVGGHYPVYSAGFHGPTERLVERMKPLLYQYNVSAYFSGHDHTLQHLHEVTEDGEMDYMVTGSATNSLNIRWHKDDVPPGSLKFWNADTVDGGFAAVSVNKELLTFTFISGEGLELYQTTVKPRSL